MKTRTEARKILIAPDKFKGTLSAPRAAEAMARGLRRFLDERGDASADRESPGDESPREIIIRPLADGGEGSHETLAALRPELMEERRELPDSVGRNIMVPWLRDERGNHYLETAKVMGLLLPGARDMAVSDRSTRGIGLWLRDLIAEHGENGTLCLHLFLGGSATSDGGFGLARGLGLRFLREDDSEVEDFRGVLEARRLEFPPESPRARIVLLTDVESPLTGPEGAASLFAGQKGADAGEIALIEERLTHMLALFKKASGRSESEPPGTGAAGGLGLPLLYWPGPDARIESGIAFFLDQAGLPELFREAPPDLVLTGEGATDKGTLKGKVVEGLRRIRGDAPCPVFSGIIRDRAELRAAGYDELFGTDEFVGPFDILGNDAAPETLEAEAARRLEETVYRGLMKREERP